MEGIYFAGKNERKPSFGKGRPSLINGEKLETLLRLYYTETYSIRKLADIMGVSKTTILRAVNSAHNFRRVY